MLTEAAPGTVSVSTETARNRSSVRVKGGPALGVVLRRELGEVLRHTRTTQGRTLREVSAAARVSLGYLSEIERGQKEASSELLAAVCAALDVPLSSVLRTLSDRVAEQEERVAASMPGADSSGAPSLVDAA